MTEATEWQRVVLTVGAVLVCAGTAAAQTHVPERGGRVYGLVGGALGDTTGLMSGGGVGLRLTRHLGLDFELAHVGGGENGDSLAAVSVFRVWEIGGRRPWNVEHGGWDADLDEGRSVTTFLTRFTLEFPVAGERLFPYVTGGGGVGRVSEAIGIAGFPVPPIGPIPEDAADWLADGAGPEIAFLPGPWWGESGPETGLSLVVGGGLDVRLWRGLAIGGEVRWLRVLLSREDFDTAQVVSRVSYRF